MLKWLNGINGDLKVMNVRVVDTQDGVKWKTD